jgi:hypothetical protein
LFLKGIFITFFMLDDPLAGTIMGFLSLISGVLSLENTVSNVSPKSASCANVYSGCEGYHEASGCLLENTQRGEWGYISCSEYQKYLLEMKKKNGSLLLTR